MNARELIDALTALDPESVVVVRDTAGGWPAEAIAVQPVRVTRTGGVFDRLETVDEWDEQGAGFQAYQIVSREF